MSELSFGLSTPANQMHYCIQPDTCSLARCLSVWLSSTQIVELVDTVFELYSTTVPVSLASTVQVQVGTYIPVYCDNIVQYYIHSVTQLLRKSS